ncbi:MAG: hypothetical protein ACRC1H_09970, partial [Caldilineaceae bacterium]
VGEFSTSMRSVALSIVLLGMLLGSAMAAQADASVWGFIPLAGTLLFFGTLLLSTFVVVALVRKVR